MWFLLKFLLSLLFWWFSLVPSSLGWHQLCLLYSGSCDYMLIFSATLLLCSIHIFYLLQNIYLDQIKLNQTIVIFSIKKPLDWQFNNRRKKKREKNPIDIIVVDFRSHHVHSISGAFFQAIMTGNIWFIIIVFKNKNKEKKRKGREEHLTRRPLTKSEETMA